MNYSFVNLLVRISHMQLFTVFKEKTNRKVRLFCSQCQALPVMNVYLLFVIYYLLFIIYYQSLQGPAVCFVILNLHHNLHLQHYSIVYDCTKGCSCWLNFYLGKVIFLMLLSDKLLLWIYCLLLILALSTDWTNISNLWDPVDESTCFYLVA